MVSLHSSKLAGRRVYTLQTGRLEDAKAPGSDRKDIKLFRHKRTHIGRITKEDHY